MSGTTTEWGDQDQVTSVQLTATNPDGSPAVMLPALQGPGQKPVMVPGAAVVEAASSGAAPTFAAPETLPAGSQVTLTKNNDGTYTLGVPQGPAPVFQPSVPALPPGANVTITTNPDGTLTLSVPQGATSTVPGPVGATGATGPTGAQGVPGPPIGKGPWNYQGSYDATAGMPAIPAAAPANNAYLWLVKTVGTNLPAGLVFPAGISAVALGDAIISNGTQLELIRGFLTPQAVVSLGFPNLTIFDNGDGIQRVVAVDSTGFGYVLIDSNGNSQVGDIVANSITVNDINVPAIDVETFSASELETETLVVGAITTTDNGDGQAGLILVDSTGFGINLLDENTGGGGSGYEPCDVRNFLDGASLDMTGTVDMSVMLKGAHDEAYAAGFREMWFPPCPNPYLAPTLTQVGNVIFTSSGGASLAGAYRKQIIPRGSPQYTVSQNDLTKNHLKRFLQAVAAATPQNPAVLVMCGDSTTTGGSQAIDTATPQVYLEQQLQQQLGPLSANIMVINRGIGGQTWNQVTMQGSQISPVENDTTNVIFPWFPDKTKVWADLVSQVMCPDGIVRAPDAVLWNFGMNDQANFDYTQMDAAMARVLANAGQRFGLPPDFIFMTNYMPSNMMPNFSTQADQEGRDYVATYTVTYAQTHGYGLLDRHRQSCQVKDGFDPRAAMGDVFFGMLGQVLPFTFSTPVNDYGFSISLPNDPLDNVWAFGQMVFPLSPKAGNVLLLGCDAATGNLTYQVNRATGDVETPLTVSRLPCTGNGIAIYVNVVGSRIQIECGPVYSSNSLQPAYWAPAVFASRHGGLFTPTISMTNGEPTTNFLVRARKGVFKTTQALITDAECFSTYGATSDPFGGNGQNHLASQGSALIDLPIYESLKFSF